MKKEQLVEELINFLATYRIFDNVENMKAENIMKQLEYAWFVEHLIHIIIIKTSYIGNIDHERLKVLLLELEKIRLDLEYEAA